MDSLGDYLKQGREKKGLSLEHIASQTRIQEHHLLALEAEDFSSLPAKVFVKGFVRSYAKILGLDEEEALQRFLHTSGHFYEEHQAEQLQPHAKVTLEAPPRQGPNWILILGVIALFVLLGIWFGLPKKQEQHIVHSEAEMPSPVTPIEEPTPSLIDPPEQVEPTLSAPSLPIPVPAPTPAAPTPPPTPITGPIPNQPKPVPPAATSSESTTPVATTKPSDSTTNEGPHILEIEATQLTWVVVKSDEQAPKEALLQPGQHSTWKANQQFLVTLGNAAGVALRLNGKPQGPFGKPGQVVRDIRLRP